STAQVVALSRTRTGCNLIAGCSLGRPKGRSAMITLATSEVRKPSERGYHAVYREHDVNHCPGCGRTQWLIGRMSAECAFCATALPLAEASMRHHNGPIVI